MNSPSPLHKAIVAALALGIGASSAYAAEPVDSQDKDKKEKEERIEITGSRIKRTDLEDAAPVVVISNEEMQARGHLTVSEALRNLSQNTGQIQGAEFAGFTPDVQTVNLRSIGVGYTLMLVNGRRAAAYPAAYNSETSVANYGAIPTAAVERVEILTTGASAIYGSDAVAGVINIILKKNIDETTLNVLWGTADEADRDNKRIQLLTGKTWDTGSLSVALEAQETEGIVAGDYKHIDSWYDYPYGQGFVDRAIVEIGYMNQTGYRDPGAQRCTDAGNGSVRSFRPGSGYYCGMDLAADRPLRNPREQVSGFVNFTQELTDNLEAYATLMWYKGESSNKSDTRFIWGTFYTGTDYFLGQRAYTSAELGRDLNNRFEDTSTALSAGLKGVMFEEHDWELNIARSDYEYEARNVWWKADKVVEYFMGDLLLLSGANTVWAGNGKFSLADNLYAPLPANIVNEVIGEQVYGNETFSQSIQFTVSGVAFEMPSGPAQYALVVEHENSGFKFNPDERIRQAPPIAGLQMTGWWNLTGYFGDGERDRSAIGGELALPVLDSVTVNFAARQDFYDKDSSKSGGRVTPAVSVEWRPVDGFFVRGGYSESFRAPDLNYVYSNTGAYTSAYDYAKCQANFVKAGGNGANFDPADCGVVASIYFRRAGSTSGLEGAEKLDDETGYAANLGFVWDITDDLNVSVDYFRQYLQDRVITESIGQLMFWEYQCDAVAAGYKTYADFPELNGGARCAYVDARIPRLANPFTGENDVGTVQASPINSAELLADSLDIKANYKTDLGPVTARFNLDYTLSLKHKDRDREGDPWFDNLKDAYVFRSIVGLTSSFSWNDFELTLTGIRRGSMNHMNQNREQLVGVTGRLSPYTTYNLALGYTISPESVLRLRVTNLLNEKPPRDRTATALDHPWYNVFSYSGAGIGRQLALDYTHTF